MIAHFLVNLYPAFWPLSLTLLVGYVVVMPARADNLQLDRPLPGDRLWRGAGRHHSFQLAQAPSFPEIEPPSTETLPELAPSAPLPAPGDLLPPSPPAPMQELPTTLPQKVIVERFEVVGNTVFSDEELAQVTAPFTNRPLSFAELLAVRSAITDYYVEQGYITSGAFLPPQELINGVAVVEVVEGEIETIEVEVEGELSAGYVRDRLDRVLSQPLDIHQLRAALELLQLDPRVERLAAELTASPRPGKSILKVSVSGADTFNAQLSADNGRVPSVGSFRRSLSLNDINFLGFGDTLFANYVNTDGSDTFEVSYALPINARNGNIILAYGTTSSDVIEEPFNAADIEAESRYYEASLRQPLILNPRREVALGVTFSRLESETALLDTPFPLSPGADEEGRTRISAIRFFQEWFERDEQQAIAFRSQFSFGIDAFDATLNTDLPDSRFFAWRLQGQWVRRIAENTLVVVRTDLQLADQALVPLEQFNLGGLGSVRGYRQDVLLSDNGFFASTELRLPILEVSQWDAVLQITPFVDIGTAWNNSDDKQATLDPNTLVGAGLGLRWQQGDRFTARIEWGLPLVEIDTGDEDTLQENGVYFSINYSPF